MTLLYYMLYLYRCRVSYDDLYVHELCILENHLLEDLAHVGSGSE